MKRVLASLAIAVALGACGRDDVQFTDSDGDVAGYRRLDYEVTSERYRQWFAAQRALDGVEIGEPVDVDLRNLREEDIDRVQKSIETHAAARASIEGAGMSVRDFVLTTIALAQPWAESNQAVSARVNVADPGPTVVQHASNATQTVRAQTSGGEGRGKKKGKKKWWR